MKPRRLFTMIALCLLLRPAAGRGADGKLLLTVVNAKTQKPVACRMHLMGPGKRPKRIEGARPVLERPLRLPRQDHARLARGVLHLRAGARAGILQRDRQLHHERTADDSSVECGGSST